MVSRRVCLHPYGRLQPPQNIDAVAQQGTQPQAAAQVQPAGIQPGQFPHRGAQRALGMEERAARFNQKPMTVWLTGDKRLDTAYRLDRSLFDERTGLLMRVGTTRVDGPRLDLWRAPTDNDHGMYGHSVEPVWREVRECTRAILRAATIADAAARTNKDPMYYI